MGPIWCIKVAIFHTNEEPRLSLEEAIKCYTYYPSGVSREENIKGMIKEGMLADIVILNRNLDEIELEEFHDVEVLYTIVGGKIAYKRD